MAALVRSALTKAAVPLVASTRAAGMPALVASAGAGAGSGVWHGAFKSSAPAGEAFAETGVRPMEDVPAVYPEGSVYSRGGEQDIFRQVYFEVSPEDEAMADPEFRELVNKLFAEHKPSAHPFFANLKSAPESVVKNEGWLNEFYKRYQAAMHITRAMVWYAPYLDNPIQRQRKCAIIADDDALGGKNSHHKQLENMFARFGASPLPEDAFGEPEELRKILDPETAAFVDIVERLYKQTTGAWCIAEVLSDDWLSALADSFTPFFDGVNEEQYFDEIFTGHIEILHMLETVSLSEDVMARHPEVREATFEATKEMAKAVDGLWDNLNNLVQNPEPYMS